MNLDNFFNFSGFNQISQADYETISKALSAGTDIGGTTQTGGGAMRREELDANLAILTERAWQITLFNEITKKPTNSTAVEYAQRTALSADEGGWLDEGELPEARDDTYVRKATFVKHCGTVKDVTIVNQLVNSITPQIKEAQDAGTMWVSRNIERKLFEGNSKLGLAGAEFVEIDGLETYIERDATTDHVKNLWGTPLEEANMRDGGQTIIDYHGRASHCYMPSKVLEDYALGYLPQWMHRPADQVGGNVSVGYALNRLQTVVGDYALRPVYLYDGLTRVTPPSGSRPARAPTPATFTVGVAIQATGTGQWENSLGIDDAAKSGSVQYQVALGNKYGLSTIVSSASQAISYANRVNSVRVTITNPVGGYQNAPTYAAIYRNDTNAAGAASGYYCVGRISLTSVANGASGLVWDDDGDNMPGTYRAWMGQLRGEDGDILCLRELMKFSKIPLPRIALSDRFALAWFGTLQCRDPFKFVMFKNIGRRSV